MVGGSVTDDRRVYWARKFAEYNSALKGYFLRRVSRLADAEDLAQEVYLRLLRTESTGGVRIKNPEAYLYTVAVNLLRERAILSRRGQNIALEDVAAELISPEVSGEESVACGERERKLAEVIDGLPHRTRAAIIMHYRDGLTYRNIAEKTGVTVHAVKQSISRGLQNCRRKTANHSLE